MICKCPNCRQTIEVLVQKLDESTQESTFVNFCFPKTWSHYPCWLLADVENEDPEYIDELLSQVTPRVGGKLRDALEYFVEKRK